MRASRAKRARNFWIVYILPSMLFENCNILSVIPDILSVSNDMLHGILSYGYKRCKLYRQST